MTSRNSIEANASFPLRVGDLQDTRRPTATMRGPAGLRPIAGKRSSGAPCDADRLRGAAFRGSPRHPGV